MSFKKGKGVYHHNVGVLGSTKSPDGYWYSHQILNVGNYINFVDALLPDDPRSYVFNQSKDKKTLTISDTMEVYDPQQVDYGRAIVPWCLSVWDNNRMI